MPVLIQGSSVVVRNDALERCLEDGAEEFVSTAPNSRAYSDDYVSQCSFMTSADAEDFLQRLALRGIEINGESPEALIVHSSDQEPPGCDWLTVFEYQKHVIGRHRDDESSTVTAYDGWDPEKEPEIQQYTQEEIAEKLEFVRRDDNVEVYRHKETGQEYYVGRTTESLEELYERAHASIRKYLRNPGAPPAPKELEPEIREAIDILQRVVVKTPRFWQAFLFLGKGWHALDENERAYANFIKAFEIDDTQTVICKELAGVCIDLGRAEEGVKYAQHAVSIEPTSAELLCNLAVNLLMAGNGEAAIKAINRAMELDSDDPVNQTVDRLVKAVTSGKRPYPKSFADLRGKPAAKKKPWWKKLLGS